MWKNESGSRVPGWRPETTARRPGPLRRALLLAGLAAVVALLVGSCTEEPPPYLSGKDRELIDTLYIREVRMLRPQLDSLCEARFEREVQRSVDSMLAIRRQEEARLRERIKLNQ